jgi:hypothetical protein
MGEDVKIDDSPERIFDLVSETFFVLIYAFYIYKLRKSLNKNGQKVNNYIKATLICLGISSVLMQTGIIKVIIAQQMIEEDSIESVFGGFLN